MAYKQKGFSLIELMVTVAMISILASIAIPNYQEFRQKIRVNQAKSLLGQVYKLEKIFFQEFGSYTARFDQMLFQTEGKMYYRIGFDGDFQAVTINAPPGTATCRQSCIQTSGDVPVCSFTPGWICDPTASHGSDSGVGSFANRTQFLIEAHAHLDETVFGGNAQRPNTWTIDENGRLSSVPNPN